jgi:hypothetical protein
LSALPYSHPKLAPQGKGGDDPIFRFSASAESADFLPLSASGELSRRIALELEIGNSMKPASQ